MFRRLAPKIGFIAALVVASAAVAPLARAQTNIDQGKSSAEIFANDCAVCHKSTRGLAAGKNSLMLSGFLTRTLYREPRAGGGIGGLCPGGGRRRMRLPAAADLSREAARAAVEEPNRNPARRPAQSPKQEPSPTNEAHPATGGAEGSINPSPKPRPAGRRSLRRSWPRPPPTRRRLRPKHPAKTPIRRPDAAAPAESQRATAHPCRATISRTDNL